jgi:hypothetical protein
VGSIRPTSGITKAPATAKTVLSCADDKAGQCGSGATNGIVRHGGVGSVAAIELFG